MSWKFSDGAELDGDELRDAYEAATKEIERLGKEVEDLMRVDYWQDRYNIMVKERDTHARVADVNGADLLELRAKSAKLVEALKYYSDKEEWRLHWFKMPRASSSPSANELPEEFKGYEVAERAFAEYSKGESGK